MKIAVAGNDDMWNELKDNSGNAELIRVQNNFEEQAADVFFISDEETQIVQAKNFYKSVFINSVVKTLPEINATGNFLRINGWPGFLKNELWEIAGNIDEEKMAVLNALNKKFIVVADEPGFVSARVIAMIINEAYFAIGDNVSDKKDIDIAMKLGTNYPYGPFEWGDIIGLKNIYDLLKKLSHKDKRYKPSPALAKKIL